MIALTWTSLMVGIRYGFLYGWLAANTHWLVERGKKKNRRQKSGRHADSGSFYPTLRERRLRR